MKQCPQCGRKFESDSPLEDEWCPRCSLRGFRRAEKAGGIPADLAREQETLARRQSRRLRRLARLVSGGGMSAGQIVCAASGLLLMAAALLLFWLSSAGSGFLFGAMSPGSRMVCSVMAGGISALLLVWGGRRRPLVFFPLAVLMLAWSFHLPAEFNWPGGAAPGSSGSGSAAAAEAADGASAHALSGEELEILENTRALHDGRGVWGVYVAETTNNDVREQLRRFLLRVARAEKAVSYGRRAGFLFVLENSPASAPEMEAAAERLGKVLCFSPEERLIEVAFDANKSRYVNSFPSEVLMSSAHPSFVPANLEELRSIDSARVMTAARNLEGVRSAAFREKVRGALLQSLDEPWNNYEHVQTALVRSLIAYAREEDPEAVEAARKLFRVLAARKLSVPRDVTDFLLERDADGMKGPVLELWLESPVVWDACLSRLGAKAEPELLALLRRTDSLQVTGGLIKHLGRSGSAASLPLLREFSEHPDDIVSKAARDAIEDIRRRCPGGG